MVYDDDRERFSCLFSTYLASRHQCSIAQERLVAPDCIQNRIALSMYGLRMWFGDDVSLCCMQYCTLSDFEPEEDWVVSFRYVFNALREE